MSARERTDDANQPDQRAGQVIRADRADRSDDVEPTTIEQRWRLALGVDASGHPTSLSEGHRAMDTALADLYDVDPQDKGRGGLDGSAPHVARWLGDIRRYFPSRVVRVMQTDAIDRLDVLCRACGFDVVLTDCVAGGVFEGEVVLCHGVFLCFLFVVAPKDTRILVAGACGACPVGSCRKSPARKPTHRTPPSCCSTNLPPTLTPSPLRTSPPCCAGSRNKEKPW